MDTTISQGAIWGTIGFAVVLLVCVVVAVTVFTLWRSDGDGFWLGSFIFTVVIGLFASVQYVSAMWPFDWEYHEWRPTAGTVQDVASRTLADENGGMTQRFVVRFTNGDERACDDTRCSLLKPGDELSLTCKREWQWAGAHGWSCNYVDSKRR